jgi:hypothetical protein
MGGIKMNVLERRVVDIRNNKGQFIKGIKLGHRPDHVKEKISKANSGKGNGMWRGGKPYCQKCGIQVWWGSDHCRSCSKLGERSYFWKGGITPINLKIRMLAEYKLWRTAVYERDNYTCIWCGQRGKELNADHIKPFSLYPELRFAIDNGRTLCISCHKKTDTYGSHKK